MKPQSLLCLLALLLMPTACQQEAPVAETTRPKRVASLTLEPGAQSVERQLSGIVQPADTADLSFEVPGKVATVSVDLGARFTRGDVLATLDEKVYALTVKQREGEVSEAAARLVEAENDFARKQKLVGDGAVSGAAFDLSKSRYLSAKDQVAIAETRLEIAREDLADTALIAPFDGTVSARFIEPSQRVAPGEPALEVQGNATLEVSVSVPESLVGDLTFDQTAAIRFPALPGLGSVAGIVSELGARAGRANAFPVTLEVRDQNDALKPGMTAEVVFTLSEKSDPGQRFTIPVSAFEADRGDGHYLFRIGEDGTLEKVPIEILELMGQEALIRGDLERGQRIVRTGLSFLLAGQRVVPMDEGVTVFNP